MAGDSGNEGKRDQNAQRWEIEPPEVSVVIPVYNGAKTLRRALDSVLLQNVSLEVLVVDDCSEDEIASVMACYQDYPQIKYQRNPKNLGAAQSRNYAVKKARGKFVAFLDSDDWWAPDKLKKQLDVLKAGGHVLCCTARELVTPEGKPTGRIIGVKKKISYRELLHHNSINCSSVLVKTDVIKEFPMEHEDSHEDYITWLRILKKYGCAEGINEPLLYYRLSAGGKSGNKMKSAYMTFQVYRYMGFGWCKSALCFVSYALHGVIKYAGAYIGRKK